MYSLLDKEDGVRYLSIGQKDPLVLRNERGEERFEACSHDFCQDFVGGVTQRYGSKPREGQGSIFFRNEGKVGGVSKSSYFSLALSPS